MKKNKELNSDEEFSIKVFLDNHPRVSFFQSLLIRNLFNDINGITQDVIISKNEKGDIDGLLFYQIFKNKGFIGKFSSRCIIWGGPLLLQEDSNALNKLLMKLEKLINKRVIYTEFRNLYDLSNFKKQFDSFGYKFKPHLNYIVSIEKIKNGEKKISSSKKRQIKKSLQSGAKIIEPNSLEQIKEFYHILKNLYKKKIKKPLPDFTFFEKFYYSNKLGKYFLIKYEEKIIGGIMCPIYKETIYELYICGLDSKYKHIYPSVLATWAPINYAISKGIKHFDFMGAGSPNKNYGVREFKSKFGGELVQFGRYIRINNPFLFFIGNLGMKIRKYFKYNN